ncbi:MAG: class I SAM-dependent methyltransferase [Methermicoccaceae archaeon]
MSFSSWNGFYLHAQWAGLRNEALERMLSMLKEPSLVLDVGCGDGRYLLQLKPSLKVVGLDSSDVALGVAASRLCARHLTHPLMCADALFLPFKDGTFDAVLCLGVVHHLLSAQRARVMEEIKRVLRSGGLLCMSVHGADDVRSGAGRCIEEGTYLKGNGILTHYFTLEELGELLSGFEPVWVDERRHKKQLGRGTYTRHDLMAVARSGP